MPLAYRWQRDTGSLDFSDLPGRTNATLLLTNVAVSDGVNYRVVVSDAGGTTNSDAAHLYLALPSTLQFAQGSYTVAEGAGEITLSVRRTGAIDTVVSVDYATADGTATNGLKYTAVSGTLNFATGETNQTIVVPILNNCFADRTKMFRVTLSNPVPSGAAVLGVVRTNVNVTITDIDVGVQFVSDGVSAAHAYVRH